MSSLNLLRHRMRPRIQRSLLLAGMACLLLTLPARADLPDAAALEGWHRLSQLGEGFVVWESNRSGRWRIWRRDLDGSGLRQISPEEDGRDHFCPHISTDGRNLVYLSYAAGETTYVSGPPRKPVQLWLLATDGSSRQQLSDSARAYFEDRAAVWINEHKLIYIDHAGLPHQLDVVTGRNEPLLRQRISEHGWLINASKTFATTGEATFSPYDPAGLKIAVQSALPGCQPYFTHDGRWGFWMGGGGGPINRVNLQTRQASPILTKNDPRMPRGRDYLYFPMVSRCGRLFACAASPGQHDHFTSDYDVFVAAIDPATLELQGKPVRYTFDPANDRFPDVFLADLELGRTRGEAPFTVKLTPRDGEAAWHWEFGDGAQTDAKVGQHTFELPGEYAVRAQRENREIRGTVTVLPAAPPRVLQVSPTGDNGLVIEFDEPVEISRLQSRLNSGLKIASVKLADDQRQVVLALADHLSQADTLHFSGVTDRAQRPNLLAPQAVKVEPLQWPSNRAGLVFLFETADRPNQVQLEQGEAPRSFPLRPRGRARLDHDQALVVAGGAYEVEGADQALLNACRKSNELTIEAVIRPDDLRQTGPARIVTFSSSAGSRNFTLGQQDDQLILRLRTPQTGENGVNPETKLGPLTAGKPLHVVVTYRPGKLVAYVNGREIYRGNKVMGDFHNWQPHHLLLGDEFDGQRDWSGSIEGVALYARALEPSEVARNAAQYLRRVQNRPQVERIALKARLVARSAVPTLAEIKPYRAALMVCKYEVRGVTQGTLPEQEILVAQWAVLDGEPQPVTQLKIGSEVPLLLEAWERNPQLQRFVCKDDFDSDEELLLPRYYDVSP